MALSDLSTTDANINRPTYQNSFGQKSFLRPGKKNSPQRHHKHTRTLLNNKLFHATNNLSIRGESYMRVFAFHLKVVGLPRFIVRVEKKQQQQQQQQRYRKQKPV